MLVTRMFLNFSYHHYDLLQNHVSLLCGTSIRTNAYGDLLGKRISDQGIVYKIGLRNRHWDAFAEKCINNRTIRRGPSQSCIVLERCTVGEVSRMQFILFLSVFISDGALIWGRCQKIVPGLT